MSSTEAQLRAQRKHRASHRAQRLAYGKKYYREHPKRNRKEYAHQWNEKNKNKRRQYNILKNYGLSPEEHEEILREQEYRCAFPNCGQEIDFYSHIDHNHATGKVRGILCQTHNLGLGFFEKYNPMCLLDAFAYLQQHKEAN